MMKRKKSIPLNVKSCLIYDAKRNFYSALAGMGLKAPLYILNYRDARCAIWDIARDIASVESCRALGEHLSAPKEHGKDGFWTDVSQYSLEGLALFFHLNAPGHWDFRDILVSIRSLERLVKILGSDARTQKYVHLLNGKGGERLSHSILVTAQTYLSKFEPIAAAWHQKKKLAQQGVPVQYFCFADLPHKYGIYLLGRDVENMVGMSAMNRLFITTAGRVLLNQQGDDLDRQFQHLWVLDEAHTLGYLPEFEEFMTNASSRGVCVALAMQSIASFQRLYGHEATEAILGQFDNKAFLRLNDVTTANWASQIIGRGDRFMKSFTGSWSITNRIENNVPVVPPEQLRRLKKGKKPALNLFNGRLLLGGHPVKGFYTGEFGFWQSLSSRYIRNNLMSEAEVENIIDCEPPLLPTWDYADIERLNLQSVISPEEFQEHQEDEDSFKRRRDMQQLDELRDSIENVTNASSDPEDENPETESEETDDEDADEASDNDMTS